MRLPPWHPWSWLDTVGMVALAVHVLAQLAAYKVHWDPELMIAAVGEVGGWVWAIALVGSFLVGVAGFVTDLVRVSRWKKRSR